VGDTTGVLTITQTGGRRVATWKAIIASREGQKSIDISLAALDRDFEGLEGTFNAILKSFRFE
jgi:hypothetical protein